MCNQDYKIKMINVSGKIFIFLIILIWNNSFLLAQDANQVRESQNLFREAKISLQENDINSFKEKVKKALSLRPNHPTLLINYSYALVMSGQLDYAVEILEELADMGMYYELSAIDEFKVLTQKKGYERVQNKFQRNRQPVGSAKLEVKLSNKNLLLEGLAFSTSDSTYYFTSVHKQAVLKYNPVTEKYTSQELSISPLGIKFDSRRENIWVTISGLEEGENTERKLLGQGGIGRINLDNGEFVLEFMLNNDSVDHVLGDLLIENDNSIYVTDSVEGLIYHFDPISDHIKPLTQKGSLISPQGIEIASNSDRLILADYSIGLLSVNKVDGKVVTISNETNTTLLGIDGIYRYRDSIIAIQNGTRPNRIIQLKLNHQETSVIDYKVLLANHKDLDDPTLGQIVGDKFLFNANSQWVKFNPRLNSDSNERVEPKILSIDLN